MMGANLTSCPRAHRHYDGGSGELGPMSDRSADDDVDDDSEMIRIPIEIKPRGRLGLKAAVSLGRVALRSRSAGGGGGSAQSAFSLELGHPEMERARREWELACRGREQELVRLQARLDSLELRHRRVCTELKTLQRRCAQVSSERESALVGEQQALARAALFQGERDRARHQLAACREALQSELSRLRRGQPTSKPRLLPAWTDDLSGCASLLEVDFSAHPDSVSLTDRFLTAVWRRELTESELGVGSLRVLVTGKSAVCLENAGDRLSALLRPSIRDISAGLMSLTLLVAPRGGTAFSLAAVSHVTLTMDAEALEDDADWLEAGRRCCERAAVVMTTRTPSLALSRCWLPPSVRLLLTEQHFLLRHALRSHGAGPGSDEWTAGRTTILDASHRPRLLAWLRSEWQRPEVLYFSIPGLSGGLSIFSELPVFLTLMHWRLFALSLLPDPPRPCPADQILSRTLSALSTLPRPLCVILDCRTATCPWPVAQLVLPAALSLVCVVGDELEPPRVHESLQAAFRETGEELKMLLTRLVDFKPVGRAGKAAGRLLEAGIVRPSVLGFAMTSQAVWEECVHFLAVTQTSQTSQPTSTTFSWLLSDVAMKNVDPTSDVNVISTLLDVGHTGRLDVDRVTSLLTSVRCKNRRQAIDVFRAAVAAWRWMRESGQSLSCVLAVLTRAREVLAVHCLPDDHRRLLALREIAAAMEEAQEEVGASLCRQVRRLRPRMAVEEVQEVVGRLWRRREEGPPAEVALMLLGEREWGRVAEVGGGDVEATFGRRSEEVRVMWEAVAVACREMGNQDGFQEAVRRSEGEFRDSGDVENRK